VVDHLELKMRDLLDAIEVEWRLKSSTLWLACGDENTNCFHHQANHRRNLNTIQRMQNREGEGGTSFEYISNSGLEHFVDVYKEESTTTIVEVVKMATFFPSFVNEEENESLLEEVSKDELHEVLHSFQKNKSPCLDSWHVEFFMGFYDLNEGDLLRVIKES